MRFYEFEAKRLLGKHGIPVCQGGNARTAEEAERLATEIGCPVALKAQVLAGDVGKAGGLKTAEAPAEVRQAAAAILGLAVDGQQPRGVLVEKKTAVTKEYCVHVTYDAVRKLPVMIASDVAGQDIDDVAEKSPGRVKRRHFSTLIPMSASAYKAKELVRALGLTGSDLTRMSGIVARLAELFLRYDLTVAEINPLGRLADGKFVAVDCRMDMEEEGRVRQKGILAEFGIGKEETRGVRGEPTPFEVEAARIDAEDPRGIIGPVVEFDGNMGLVIGAGGGSLTIFDAVKKHGGRPANYAAIGGNPSVKKAERLTKLVLTKPGVDKIAVMSNVVSNTRADLVARGVIKGVLALGFKPAEKVTIFRVPGAWEADAFKILRKYGIEFCDRTVSLSEAARRAVAKIQPAGS